MPRHVGLLVSCLAASLIVSACGDAGSRPPGPAPTIIKASDTDCEVETSTFDVGTQIFSVSNAGSQVTEVFVYATGDRVVGEVEDIGPSTSKRLTVALKPGAYQIACRPGMAGPDIRTPIVVKGPSGTPPVTSPQVDAAIAGYRRYVVTQAELLQTRTKPFVEAVLAGDVSTAKSLYASARIPYETIEPVAESLGDLDPRIDARIDDVEVGQTWSGFHRLEHDLWTSGDVSDDGAIATELSADISKLVDQARRVELSAAEIAAGAKSLITGISESKITGEEERYSGLDLVDVAASAAGSHMAYAALRPIVAAGQPELVAKIDTRYETVQQDLSPYGSGASFEPYDELSKSQIKALADDVDALSSSLSQFVKAVQKQ